MMNLPHYSRAYENWAPVVARVMFGVFFLVSAYYKIPGTEGFTMGVQGSGAAGIPFPLIAMWLAFLLELLGGIALVVGWRVRTAAFLFIPFMILIAAFFFHNLADQTQLGMFIGIVGQVAGLLYVSVYGAQHAALAKDKMPIQ